jgi:hypothetical protein
MLRAFASDERAEVDWWTILQFGLLLLIPAGLFVFWVQYLRRLGQDDNAKYGPWGAPQKAGQVQAPAGDMKRVCPKCGLTVRPPRGSGPPVCPNCMSVL